MQRKINYGKMLAVILLTAFIWIWADLNKTEQFPVSNATVSIAKSTNPNLWVSFNDKSSFSIKEIVLKGSSSKVVDVKRNLDEGSLALEFFLVPEQEEAMTEPGQHFLEVPAFLKKSDLIKQLGLTVVSCEPTRIPVNVVKLVEKPLAVQCVGDDGNPLKNANITPSQVNMLVPADWEMEKLVAWVSLTRAELNQAKLAVLKKPFVKLATGIVKEADTTVKITIPPEEILLTSYTITPAKLGFVFSANLQEDYKVELLNPDVVMGPIAIRATLAAKQAYDQQPFKMILFILDDDKKTTDELRRKVVYNFPEEFVRKDEIVLNQQPAEAQFKLILISPAKTP